MTFRAIPNHSTNAVVPCAPWDEAPNFVRPEFESKDHFRAWCASKEVDHRFITSYEGITSSTRVSKSNEAFRMHGLVVDYDADINEADVEGVMTRASTAFPPNYVATTFSGGRRLIWVFEEPVLVMPNKAHKEFLRKLRRELGLVRLLPGLDDDALFDSAKTYEIGRDWKQLSDQKIPASALGAWSFEAGEQMSWREKGEVVIPIEVIAKEVEKVFPGTWPGDFIVGARGPRFWDNSADNHTAAIVRETGMQCFTGGRAFVPWSEILGAKFVGQYQENKVHESVKDLWYDGRHYWVQGLDDRWVRKNRDDVSLQLRVAHGLSPERPREGGASEVDRGLYHIQSFNGVEAALPFVLQKPGLLFRDGARYLNISNVKALVPCDEPGIQWGDPRFGFISKFLCPKTLFSSPEQWEYFMAWLQYFYQGAVVSDVQNGHSIFIAGPEGRGKTLLSNVLIGSLVGGRVDVTSFLLGETTFNSSLFNSPLWCVDDSQPGKDPRTHAHFSAMVKKLTANQNFEFNAKFRDAASINWRGRLVVTLNTDPESLAMLPNPEISILDKISFFQMSDREFNFPHQADAVIAQELPYFARWLLDWCPDPKLVVGGRYGVSGYHDDHLLLQAKMSGKANEFREVLNLWARSYFAADSDTAWEGTSTELLSVMKADASVSNLIGRYTPVGTGRELSKLQSLGFDVSSRVKDGMRVWTIRRPDDLFKEGGGA